MSGRDSASARDLGTAGQRRALFAAIIGAVVTLVGASPTTAFAEPANTLVTTEPANAEVLTETPTELVFTFSQPVRDDQQLDVALSCPDDIDLGAPELGGDRLVFTVAITGVVPRGPCIAQWSLTGADDVELLTGIVSFTVDADPPVSTPAPAASSTTAGTAATTTVAAGTVDTPSQPATGVEQRADGDTNSFGRLFVVGGLVALALVGGISIVAIGVRRRQRSRP